MHRAFGDFNPSYPTDDNAVFWNTHRSYRPNWDIYRYHPALARRLLERAGCRRGADRIYVCAGERLSLRARGDSGVPYRARIAELIERYLEQIGVEVVLSFAPTSPLSLSLNKGELRHGRLRVARRAITTGIYGCGAAQNYTGYCQRLVTADLDQADRILDEGQRARVLNRIDRRLAKDVP